MSHFLTVVLVEPGTEDIEARVGELLAPYDEDLEVPEYDRDCGCGDRRAELDARRHADATVRPLDELRDEWNTWIRDELDRDGRFRDIEAKMFSGSAAERKSLSKEDEAYFWEGAREAAAARVAAEHGAWDDHVADWRRAHDAHLAAHPLRGKADPECGFYTGERQDWWAEGAEVGDRYEDGSGCGGTGTYRTTTNPRSRWDWWQIGGRWTGAFDPAYSPEDDPQNIEMCFLCHGTGRRYDSGDVCNACCGDGRKTKWPTQFARFNGDVRPVAQVPPEVVPFALVTPRRGEAGGEWHQKAEMGWWGMARNEKAEADWDAEVKGVLADYPDHLAVVVDCHV